ncbi:MAG: hypothetical protein ACFFED_06985 [Candidatus Thorarchaeota archaeon]
MCPTSWKEFDPPNQGLNEGETIEWDKKAGINFILFWCSGCLPLLTILTGWFILAILGERIGTIVLLIMGLTILYLLYLMIQAKRTRYFITSQRLLEVRGGLIQKEILLENLQEFTPDQFMSTSVSHDEGAYTYYNVTITDPSTSTAIRMTAMREDILDVLKRLGKSPPI